MSPIGSQPDFLPVLIPQISFSNFPHLFHIGQFLPLILCQMFIQHLDVCCVTGALVSTLGLVS